MKNKVCVDCCSMSIVALKNKVCVHCCYDQAESNPAFAAQLEDILLSDNLKRDKPQKRPRVDVDVVSELAKTGPVGLRKRLDSLAESELRQVAKADRALNGKEVKEADRTRLIDALLAYADRKLNQGGSFLGVSKTDNAPSTPA